MIRQTEVKIEWYTFVQEEREKKTFLNDIKLIYIEIHEKKVYDFVTFPSQNFHLILLQPTKWARNLNWKRRSSWIQLLCPGSLKYFMTFLWEKIMLFNWISFCHYSLCVLFCGWGLFFCRFAYTNREISKNTRQEFVYKIQIHWINRLHLPFHLICPK